MEFTGDGNHALNAVISAVIAGTSLALQSLFAEWIRLDNILVLVFIFWPPVRSMTRSLLSTFLPREQSYLFSNSYLGRGLSVLFALLWLRGSVGKHALSYLLGLQNIAELIDWWLQCLRSDDPSIYAVDSGCFVVVKFLASSYWISMLAVLYMGLIARTALTLTVYAACIAACMAMVWLIAGKTHRADKFVKSILAASWLLFTMLDVYEVIDARLRVGIPEYISTKLAQMESRRKAAQHLSEYRHDPVSHSDREIRLLTIQKGSFLSGMVKTSIMTTTLANAPPYEAISYCWGSSYRTREILINGQRFAVTDSAHSVLQARRSAWQDRIVWIDSICINQRDNQEKNHQVSMMGDIYQSATRVLVWLGGGWQQRLAASAITEIFANSVALQGSEIGTEMHYHFDRNRSYRPVWDALTELAENPYFSRIWIAQEVALNKNVHVFCGRRYHEWEHVVRTILYCFSPRRESLLSKNDEVVEASRGISMHNLTMLSMLWEPGRGWAIGDTDGLALADALYYCSKFKATDARDRVFGLGGMVPTSPITPRYDCSEDQVFVETARQILPGSMRMLAFAGIGYPRKLDQLPSWVPDWSMNQPNHVLWHTLHTYHTAGTTTADVTFDVTAGSLTARGIILDAVVAVSSSRSLHVSEEEKEISMREFIQRISDFHEGALSLLKSHPNAWSGDIEVALHTTLTAGRRSVADLPIYQLWKSCLPTGKAPTPAEPRRPDVFNYQIEFNDCGQGRRVCVTSTRTGLVPLLAEVGDVVAIFHGSPTPYVLRKAQRHTSEGGVTYRLVGECFFDGIMNGEAVTEGISELITLV